MKKSTFPDLQTVCGQPSWPIACDKVAAYLTRLGGHLGPVEFRLGRRIIAPYSVAPWAEERLGTEIPALLRVLRGDFFCAPFGGNATPYRGETHPPHGDPANGVWQPAAQYAAEGSTTWQWSLTFSARHGRIDKFITLRQGETNVYCRHVLSEMDGVMSYGHHAMLKFPGPEGSGLLTTSPLRYGQVAPRPFELPAKGGYQFLEPGAVFKRLDRVSALDKTRVDLSRYPARPGFEDLVQLVHRSAPNFAWVAVTFPRERFVWFSLKDPRVLSSTVLWMSNGGRHYPPWNGRHTAVLGIEEVTSYFHYGLAESARPNPIQRLGHATCVRLRRQQPHTIRYIMGVAEVPRGFSKVTAIERTRPGIITLVSPEKMRVEAAVDTTFLYDETGPIAGDR